MTEPIKFYLDFSSPYSYFAAHKIEATVAPFGRDVAWKPFLLGKVFSLTGGKPLTELPMKGDYCKHDFQRMARFMRLPWVFPNTFPIATQAVARAFYWLDDQDTALAKKFALAAFASYFGRGENISSPDKVAAIAATLGVDREKILDAVAEDAIKQRLKDETQSAINAGVFGAPYFIIDGEGIWGADRMWMIKYWLKSGGW